MNMKKDMPFKPSKVLVIGSGPIIIGQAAEFDYAGTQACKALREEGVITVLVNSNPATIMTDEGIADIVYIEPLTVEVISRIIEAERPDGILATLGGQTGLNLAVELDEAGVLERFNVKLIGTPLGPIKKAEDREMFRDFLISIGEPVPPSKIVNSMTEAEHAAEELGFPVMLKAAHGGGGRLQPGPRPLHRHGCQLVILTPSRVSPRPSRNRTGWRRSAS